MSFLVVMVLLLVVMWVLMIRPQRQRQREQQAMIEGASVGDDILTTGGIYGTIAQADGDDIVVDIADGLSVHMTRRGIAAVLPPEDEEDVGEEHGEDEEAVEAVVDEQDEDLSAEELRRRTREGAV
ncbi:MAG TPA: preprotein translocase subunit YajC [Gaiellaceae bacterium]|nr:preprotein translocase subunit YajC [Gaiellaceae bacterium]